MDLKQHSPPKAYAIGQAARVKRCFADLELVCRHDRLFEQQSPY